jgi:hypothetical protein
MREPLGNFQEKVSYEILATEVTFVALFTPRSLKLVSNMLGVGCSIQMVIKKDIKIG